MAEAEQTVDDLNSEKFDKGFLPLTAESKRAVGLNISAEQIRLQTLAKVRIH
jgi:hypothetical protein